MMKEPMFAKKCSTEEIVARINEIMQGKEWRELQMLLDVLNYRKTRLRNRIITEMVDFGKSKVDSPPMTHGREE